MAGFLSGQKRENYTGVDDRRRYDIKRQRLGDHGRV